MTYKIKILELDIGDKAVDDGLLKTWRHFND